MKKYKIYLDDIRTPIDKENWVIVRTHQDFCKKIEELGFENIEYVSLDHDLGDTAMKEWHENVSLNYRLDYDNITEETGYDSIKWLVERWMNGKTIFQVYVHSANAIGSANIMGYCNNYLHVSGLPQTCVRVKIPHTIEKF